MKTEVAVALITTGGGLLGVGLASGLALVPALRAAKSSQQAAATSSEVLATQEAHGRILATLVEGRRADEEWKARADKRLDTVVETQLACGSCPVVRPVPRAGIVPPPSPAPA